MNATNRDSIKEHFKTKCLKCCSTTINLKTSTVSNNDVQHSLPKLYIIEANAPRKVLHGMYSITSLLGPPLGAVLGGLTREVVFTQRFVLEAL